MPSPSSCLGDYSSRNHPLNPEVRRTARVPHGEPLDMERFLRQTKPKFFDPESIVTANERFDVDDFIRTIHEGRDVERKELSD